MPYSQMKMETFVKKEQVHFITANDENSKQLFAHINYACLKLQLTILSAYIIMYLILKFHVAYFYGNKCIIRKTISHMHTT